jgi:hypothetical protein
MCSLYGSIDQVTAPAAPAAWNTWVSRPWRVMFLGATCNGIELDLLHSVQGPKNVSRSYLVTYLVTFIPRSPDKE